MARVSSWRSAASTSSRSSSAACCGSRVRVRWRASLRSATGSKVPPWSSRKVSACARRPGSRRRGRARTPAAMAAACSRVIRPAARAAAVAPSSPSRSPASATSVLAAPGCRRSRPVSHAALLAAPATLVAAPRESTSRVAARMRASSLDRTPSRRSRRASVSASDSDHRWADASSSSPRSSTPTAVTAGWVSSGVSVTRATLDGRSDTTPEGKSVHPQRKVDPTGSSIASQGNTALPHACTPGEAPVDHVYMVNREHGAGMARAWRGHGAGGAARRALR